MGGGLRNKIYLDLSSAASRRFCLSPCFRARPCTSVVNIIFPWKYIFPGYVFLTTEHHGTTLNRGYMFRVSVSIREIRGRLYISLPRGQRKSFEPLGEIRNLINLSPRLACAFSQFSEINYLTLSLATLARYLNTQNFRARPCPSVVGIISHWRTSFRGFVVTTELHGTTLNRGYLFALRSAQKSKQSKPII